jgi:hypothetical protein
MRAVRFSEWIQIFGLVAVVGSLVFVGVQMRQTHEIASATLYQMRSDGAQQLMATWLESEVLSDIEAKVSAERELSDYENLIRSVVVLMFFNQFENSHYLYERGFLSEEHWASDLSAIRLYINDQEHWREIWDQQKQIFRASFVEEVDAVVQKN